MSVDALLLDEEARHEFREVVKDAGGDPEAVPERVSRVVLAMARRSRPISASDLFSFTQVTLVRSVTALESQGVQVFVALINRPEG